MKWLLMLVVLWLPLADASEDAPAHDQDTALWIIGDAADPVQFMLLPFSYSGDRASPAVRVENALQQALSSTGLLSMPASVPLPDDPLDMFYWQFHQIRFVIRGHLQEQGNQLLLRLTLYDSYGLEPLDAQLILQSDQLQYSLQEVADQVYRSLFFAAYTSDVDRRFLADEDVRMTAYLHALVQTFKYNWNSQLETGLCDVTIRQLPGGVVLQQRLGSYCYQTPRLADEIEQTLAAIESLPYAGYRQQFQRTLHLRFIHADSAGRKNIIRMQNKVLDFPPQPGPGEKKFLR